ncbi:MAG: hypothetical protein ACE5EM_01205 [Sphingomonadales bacterium]
MNDFVSHDRLGELGRLDQSPGFWSWSSRCYDAMVMALASWSLPAALRVASTIGSRALGISTFSHLEPELERLLAPLDQKNWRQTARAICRTAARNRVLTRLVLRHGYDAVAPLLTAASLDRIRELRDNGQPAIIAVLHDGPVIAIHAALHALDIPAVILTMLRQHHSETPLEIVTIPRSHDDAMGAFHLRAAALCRKKLQAGGIVFIPMDGTGTGLVDAALLGRRIEVPAGAAVLSVMTGAPIIPTQVKWTVEHKIEVMMAEPVVAPKRSPAQEAEAAVLRSVMETFDRSLRADPGQINLVLLDQLLTAPIKLMPL